MLNKKTNIIIFTDWYYPAFKAGGPVKSIYNLVHSLKDNFNFIIISSSKDIGSKKNIENIKVNVLSEHENIPVIYIDTSKKNWKKVMNNFLKECNADKYYFNSLFSFKFTIYPLLRLKLKGKSNKIILAPRGMLGNEALNIKRKKKKMFLFFINTFKLFKNITWHATGENELIEIKKNISKNSKIILAENLPYVIEKNKFNYHYKEKKKGQVNLIFFSRISQKKNLLYALNILKECNNLKGKISFDIYGPIEDKIYWNKCLSLIENINKENGIEISYKGIIMPNEINNLLKKYHFLFFPTLHENYGHVIVESLLNGIPVIISKNTPWKELEKNNAGWDISLSDKKRFEDAIKNALFMEQNEYDFLRKKTKEYILNKLLINEIKNKYIKLFSNYE